MTSPQPATQVDTIVRELCAFLAGKSRKGLAPEAIDPGANVWLAGYVDSLSYVEFLAHIESSYGVVVSDIELTVELSSVRALAGFIASHASRGTPP